MILNKFNAWISSMHFYIANQAIDPKESFRRFILYILDMVVYIGIGAILFGIMAFIVSFGSHNPEHQITGIKSFAAGLMLCGIKAILVAIGIKI